ncbi:type I-E CRISPR-associated protein Cas7/Cse4/CasC [Streptomyces sp. CA-111067]|uniref:type I-E CRISPR-associated protein Cas7/Cse4/CasC n=1 Tax=Streptomyces sp. CA-111067 TaxID=3240046 RepID=UPI003D99E932
MSSRGILSWSLADRPWIQCAGPDGGTHLLSLLGAVEHCGRIRLAAPDPLVRTATARLLLAVAYSAGCAPAGSEDYLRQIRRGVDLAPVTGWIRSNADLLDLFHPEHPLFQDASLRDLAGQREATVPAHFLDLTAARTGQLLHDHRHRYNGQPLPTSRAVELLLVQQLWAKGGRIPTKSTLYGPNSNVAAGSTAAASLLWLPETTLAELLAWRLTPLTCPVGTATWSYRPRPEDDQGRHGAPTGESDALTWMSRRILLHPHGPGGGQVALAQLAAGWRIRPDDTLLSRRPGMSDAAEAVGGKPLWASAVTSDTDLAPLAESWWAAGPGSWAATARRAAEHLGYLPDLTAAGLAAPANAGYAYARQVFIPGQLLADPALAEAADTVMVFRRRAHGAAPDPDNTTTPAGLLRRELGTVLPPGFGSDLLEDPAFRAAAREDREEVLLAGARPTRDADPVRHGRRLAVLEDAVRPADTAPATVATPGTARPATGQQELFQVADHGMPVPPAAPQAPAAELGTVSAALAGYDAGDLFVTAATAGLDAAKPRRHRRPVPDDELEWPSRERRLAMLLGAWAHNPRMNATLRDLEFWLAHPDPDSPACQLVTDSLPAGQHEAAVTTAALFALHRRRSRSAPLHGRIPVPWLMHHVHGPGHQATTAALVTMVRAPTISAMRPLLAAQIRSAADAGATPSWGNLFGDLAHWHGTGVRERWTQLYFGRRTVPPPPPRHRLRLRLPRPGSPHPVTSATELHLPDTGFTIDLSGTPGPFVTVHTLTTLSGVGLNRDQLGRPKSIAIGGAERMRISSQAQVRAIRDAMRTSALPGEVPAANSRYLPREVSRRLQDTGTDPADADPAAALIVAAAGMSVDPADPHRTRAAVILPDTAPDVLAALVTLNWDNLREARDRAEDIITHAVAPAPGTKRPPKPGNPLHTAAALVPPAIAAQARDAFGPGRSDIQLFGRMLTELPPPNGHIRSAVAVAHGFSVDAMLTFADDFATRDDWNDLGVFASSMLGQQLLASGTLYRWAALDRRRLRANLAGTDPDPDIVEATARSMERRFLTAAVYTLPSAGKSRTGAAAWPTLTVAATCTLPLTAAAAFEDPVPAPAGTEAATRLARYLQRAHLGGGIARWLPPNGEPVPAELPGQLTVEAG